MSGFSDARQSAGLDHNTSYGGGKSNGAAAAGRAAATQALKNNFPGYRGPVGTTNADTSSAGESQEPLNSGLTRTGQTTSYGAPIRVNDLGVKTALPETRTPGKPAQSYGAWQGQVDAYNQAAKQWNARGFPERAANFLAPLGLGMEPPNLNGPNTYTGGTYHLGLNPLSAIVGLGAGALLPGAGTIAGPAAGALYNEAGGRNLMLSGPDVPSDWDPNGGAPYRPDSGGGTPATPGAPGGNPTGGGPQQPMARVPGPTQPVSLGLTPPPATPPVQPPSIFPKQPSSQFANIPGGLPYGFTLYRPAA